jgi:hypothetical protein
MSKLNRVKKDGTVISYNTEPKDLFDALPEEASEKLKKPKKYKKQYEKKEFLDGWEGIKESPTLWDKMDKDVLYDAQLKSRFRDEDGFISDGNMSNHWGIGKSRGK